MNLSVYSFQSRFSLLNRFLALLAVCAALLAASTNSAHATDARKLAQFSGYQLYPTYDANGAWILDFVYKGSGPTVVAPTYIKFPPQGAKQETTIWGTDPNLFGVTIPVGRKVTLKNGHRYQFVVWPRFAQNGMGQYQARINLMRFSGAKWTGGSNLAEF